MRTSMLFAASLAVVVLAACEKPTVINTPAPIVNTPAPVVVAPPSTTLVPVPGPAGADGQKGAPGKDGDTVIVMPPATK